MPVKYGDYKIKCPYYGSTRGLRIVCHSGYSYEFRSEKDMERFKELNCKRITSCKCEARKKLTKYFERKAGRKK